MYFIHSGFPIKKIKISRSKAINNFLVERINAMYLPDTL